MRTKRRRGRIAAALLPRLRSRTPADPAGGPPGDPLAAVNDELDAALSALDDRKTPPDGSGVSDPTTSPGKKIAEEADTSPGAVKDEADTSPGRQIEEAAAAAIAMDQFANNREAIDDPSSVVVYEDEPAAIDMDGLNAPQNSGPDAQARNATFARPRVRGETGPAVPERMILYPRRTLYVQGLLLLIVAVVALGSGYFSGSLAAGTTNPTASLDVNGSTGYDQLRMRTPYTPADSLDANGNVGDIAWDDDYIYLKTATGWKRAALSTF